MSRQSNSCSVGQ